MPSHVALLYSIVLGPGSRVVMDDLRAMAASLGLERPRTVLATGNLVFEADAASGMLEERLEKAFAEAFGRHVDIIVRAGAAWPRLLAGNPFAAAAEVEPSRVAARVMREPAHGRVLAALEPYRVEGEGIAIVDGDLWGHFPHGQGNSRLAAAMTPARTGGVGTWRNWNTLRRIGGLLEA